MQIYYKLPICFCNLDEIRTVPYFFVTFVGAPPNNHWFYLFVCNRDSSQGFYSPYLPRHPGLSTSLYTVDGKVFAPPGWLVHPAKGCNNSHIFIHSYAFVYIVYTAQYISFLFYAFFIHVYTSVFIFINSLYIFTHVYACYTQITHAYIFLHMLRT